MSEDRIDINYAQALADAEKIQTIVNNIDKAVQTLDGGFKKAKSYTELNWFTQMSDRWDSFCGNDVPDTLSEMKKSKENIEQAVEKIKRFEQ